MNEEKFKVKIPNGVLRITKESAVKNSLMISVLYEFIQDCEKKYDELSEKIKNKYNIDVLSKTIFKDIEENKEKLTEEFFNDFFSLNYLMGIMITISTLNDAINKLDISKFELEVIDGQKEKSE